MKWCFLLLLCLFSALVHAEPQPYFFSEGLKSAVANCTPYTEDILEKNPTLESGVKSILLEVVGPEEDKCKVIFRYKEVALMMGMSWGMSCLFTQDLQDKLVTAMNDKSTEKKTKTVGGDGFSMTITDREFNTTLSEVQGGGNCEMLEPSEEEAVEMESRVQERMEQALAFSEEFKSNTPATFENVGMSVEVVGPENGGCRVNSRGFSIVLNPDEQSISGFDKLFSLFSDEKRTSYSPIYNYEGSLGNLEVCWRQKNTGSGRNGIGVFATGFSWGEIEVSMSSPEGTFKNGACQLLFSSQVKYQDKTKEYAIRCDIPEAQMNQYLKEYADPISQYYEISDTGYSRSGAINEMEKAFFEKIKAAGFCKNIEDLPPTNSRGCPDATPLRGEDGKCHSCGELKAIELPFAAEDDCKKVCDGFHGRPKREGPSWRCALETCPKDFPVKGGGDECLPCDFDGVFAEEDCALCPNRVVKKGYCVVTDCTNRPLVDIDGMCFSCMTEDNVPMEKGKCRSICPNREEVQQNDEFFCILPDKRR